jgi:ADP-ribose pyrophosphatase YjhB (NUDIX family)
VLAECRDRRGRVLVAPAGSDTIGLPGGLIAHGERPEAALRRHILAATGRRPTFESVLDVVTVLDEARHIDWVVVGVALDGQPRPPAGYLPEAEAEARGLTEASRRALGLGEAILAEHQAGVDEGRIRPESGVWRVQRFAVYALATDPSGRVLLAQISTGYPGAGSWHLPGGGTDPGESARAGLLRELIEETDQRGRLVKPIMLSSRHQRDALGPEGEPIDWHGVRVVFRVMIDEPTQPRVREVAGSTVTAGWFDYRETLGLSLTDIAREAISQHL